MKGLHSSRKYSLVVTTLSCKHRRCFADISDIPQTEGGIRRAYLEIIGSRLGLKKLDDWYTFTIKRLGEVGFSSSKSVYEELIEAYPNHRWYPWKFQPVPDGYWDVKANQRNFLLWLKRELNIKDWYHLSSQDLVKNGGSTLLVKYDYSPAKIVSNVFPEEKCFPWKFTQIPRGYWKSTSNQKLFLDWLAEELGFQSMNDWYKITGADICKHGGTALMKSYRSTTPKLLESVYPYHIWEPWRFSHLPKGYWDNIDNKKKWLDWASKRLQIKELDDWYRVSLRQMLSMSYSLFTKVDGIYGLLKEVYPQHNWDVTKLTASSQSNKSSQRMLMLAVKAIFEGSEVYEDYEFVSKITFDVFVPDLNVAFEYQGQQHYYDAYDIGPHWAYMQRAEDKRIISQENGISLIEVPYWWDFKKESLLATIQRQYPHLIGTSTIHLAIPSEPPGGYPRGADDLPFLMHANNWDRKKDLTGWWLSEKMDGIRAYWDGEKLYSKKGMHIEAPHNFTKDLPNTALDGELWIGRGTIEGLKTIVSDDVGDWSSIKYMVFDLPGSNEMYESRMEKLKQLALPSHAIAVNSIECKGPQHLQDYLTYIVGIGGEGLMANRRESTYTAGRVNICLKIKQIDDTDVRFIEKIPTGFRCQQQNGLECIVRCFQKDFDNPPKVDSIVTVKYTGYFANGKLKDPFFWRQRGDVM